MADAGMAGSVAGAATGDGSGGGERHRGAEFSRGRARAGAVSAILVGAAAGARGQAVRPCHQQCADRPGSDPGRAAAALRRCPWAFGRRRPGILLAALRPRQADGLGRAGRGAGGSAAGAGVVGMAAPAAVPRRQSHGDGRRAQVRAPAADAEDRRAGDPARDLSPARPGAAGAAGGMADGGGETAGTGRSARRPARLRVCAGRGRTAQDGAGPAG